MNFLTHQTIANGNRLPTGPHFRHCYIYEGQHCSCGGKYQGPNPGPELNVADVVAANEAVLDRTLAEAHTHTVTDLDRVLDVEAGLADIINHSNDDKEK